MSREILFRGKRIDNGEWVEGIPINTHIGTFIYFDENPHYCSQYGYMEIDNLALVIPETICQYTGLTDKNGKPIFDGDILFAHLDDVFQDDITYVKITWNGFSWCIRESTEDDVITKWDCDNFEVISNIFDNPELLEGGAE